MCVTKCSHNASSQFTRPHAEKKKHHTSLKFVSLISFRHFETTNSSKNVSPTAQALTSERALMKEVREHVAEGGTSHAIDVRMSDEMLVNGQNAVLTDGSRPAAFPFQMAAEATGTNNLRLIISSAS